MGTCIGGRRDCVTRGGTNFLGDVLRDLFLRNLYRLHLLRLPLQFLIPPIPFMIWVSGSYGFDARLLLVRYPCL